MPSNKPSAAYRIRLAWERRKLAVSEWWHKWVRHA